MAGAVAVPVALVATAHAAMLVAAPFGGHPFWRAASINLSEAAALHDGGEVVRLIASGHNPNRPQEVRAGFVRQTADRLTALEAAVAEDRPEILDLLVSHGAVLDPVTWTRLACFAARVEARDAALFLQRVRPAGAAATCDGIQTPW